MAHKFDVVIIYFLIETLAYEQLGHYRSAYSCLVKTWLLSAMETTDCDIIMDKKLGESALV